MPQVLKSVEECPNKTIDSTSLLPDFSGEEDDSNIGPIIGAVIGILMTALLILFVVKAKNSPEIAAVGDLRGKDGHATFQNLAYDSVDPATATNDAPVESTVPVSVYYDASPPLNTRDDNSGYTGIAPESFNGFGEDVDSLGSEDMHSLQAEQNAVDLERFGYLDIGA